MAFDASGPTGTNGEIGYEQEQEGFRLEDHLKANGFTAYDKLSQDFENGELTLDDILDCDENDLKDILNDYNIKTVQKNRFIKAIKKLPKSKMNVIKPQKELVFIVNKEHQNQLKNFVKISDFCSQTINDLKNSRTNNKDTIDRAKKQVKAVYDAAIDQVRSIFYYHFCIRIICSKY